MKAYKKLSTARKHSEGKPIIRCGELYITGMGSYSEVVILTKEGYITGCITMKKLDALGNGNYATPNPKKLNKFSGKSYGNE